MKLEWRGQIVAELIWNDVDVPRHPFLSSGFRRCDTIHRAYWKTGILAMICYDCYACKEVCKSIWYFVKVPCVRPNVLKKGVFYRSVSWSLILSEGSSVIVLLPGLATAGHWISFGAWRESQRSLTDCMLTFSSHCRVLLGWWGVCQNNDLCSRGLHAPEFIAALYDSVRFARPVDEARLAIWIFNVCFVRTSLNPVILYSPPPDLSCKYIQKQASQVRIASDAEFIVKYDSVLSGVEAHRHIGHWSDIRKSSSCRISQAIRRNGDPFRGGINFDDSWISSWKLLYHASLLSINFRHCTNS